VSAGGRAGPAAAAVAAATPLIFGARAFDPREPD